MTTFYQRQKRLRTVLTDLCYLTVILAAIIVAAELVVLAAVELMGL